MKLTKYLFYSFLIVIIGYYLTQLINKNSGVRIEGYVTGLASLMFLLVDLIFLLLFFLLKEKGGKDYYNYIFILGPFFLIGIFLSHTFGWMLLINIIAIFSLFYLLLQRRL